MTAKEYIIIDGHIYKRIDFFDGEICPICGSANLITQPGDEKFLSRVGCLDCDNWIEPVRPREK